MANSNTSVTVARTAFSPSGTSPIPRIRTRPVQRWCKTLIDYVGALTLVLLLWPLLLLVALLVYLDDGRPIIYRRRVAGVTHEFDAFKFRSMRVDADAVLHGDPYLKAEFEKNFKLKDDPRLTRIGALLRRSSLDELPQLFNILAGHMSLVGPRIITAAELPKYGPFGPVRCLIKPGLTGYWQVNGRQAIGYDERVQMDMYYIANWSLWMDLVILLKTPLKVFKAEGAY